jgi:hypothetical protein
VIPVLQVHEGSVWGDRQNITDVPTHGGRANWLDVNPENVMEETPSCDEEAAGAGNPGRRRVARPRPRATDVRDHRVLVGAVCARYRDLTIGVHAGGRGRKTVAAERDQAAIGRSGDVRDRPVGRRLTDSPQIRAVVAKYEQAVCADADEARSYPGDVAAQT